jgi:putative exosortase-associated protein (TIGR04073 family)
VFSEHLMRVSGGYWVLVLSAAVSLAGAGVASAEETPHPACPICTHANEPSAPYAATATTTLSRGVVNALLGWTELIRQPAQEARTGGNVLVGIGKGVGQGVLRTLSGVGEALTFWTPKVGGRYLRFSTDCPVCMGRQKGDSH